MITQGMSPSRLMAFMGHQWLENMNRLTNLLEETEFDRLILYRIQSLSGAGLLFGWHIRQSEDQRFP